MNKRPDFSILSPIYDFLGILAFQGTLHRSQLFLLNELKQSQNALIIGGGTGRFLVDLMKSGKVDKVTYVDISPGMIKKAESKIKKLASSDRVSFICGGLDSIPEEKFDLICTHYFLDCFPEDQLPEVMAKLNHFLSDNGDWHFTDFYLNESSSFIQRKTVGFLYWFFRLSCGIKVRKLANFENQFEDVGLSEFKNKFFRRRLIKTAIYRKA